MTDQVSRLLKEKIEEAEAAGQRLLEQNQTIVEMAAEAVVVFLNTNRDGTTHRQ